MRLRLHYLLKLQVRFSGNSWFPVLESKEQSYVKDDSEYAMAGGSTVLSDCRGELKVVGSSAFAFAGGWELGVLTLPCLCLLSVEELRIRLCPVSAPSPLNAFGKGKFLNIP